MGLVLIGATIFDGISDVPIPGQAILIEGPSITAIGPRNELSIPPNTEVIDAAGKYLIPGLMNANVHLMTGSSMEHLVRYEGHYEDLIIEAAQIALKNGLTTVFDTWGPRRPLIAVRDKINAGEALGSRIFCAGNIVGLDGPFSPDFYPKTLEVASSALVERINSLWAENVGPALTWMTPEQATRELRTYIARGCDFIKYASSEHLVPMGPTAFLAFSPKVQAAFVSEAHHAGMTAQAHTTSVEGLRVAIEAGADIIQHCNITGPTPIPDTTLQLLLEHGTASTVFPVTKCRHDLLKSTGDVLTNRIFTDATVNANVENLIRCGARLLMANDGGLWAASANATLTTATTGEDNLFELDGGHFSWFKAMQEKGMKPIEMLKAATSNIAVAYKKDDDLGTLEPGKRADIVVLAKDPMLSAENYRTLQMVLKDGCIVDREALPLKPILTKRSD